MASSFNKIMIMMIVMVVMSTIASTEAQGIPSCAQKLIPCANYINSTNTTTPPSSCCNPIQETVTNEHACLCNLYNSPGLLQSVGINITQALELAGRCGVNANLNTCAAAQAPTTTQLPPGVPGNDGSRMAWTGFSSLILIWAAFLFY